MFKRAIAVFLLGLFSLASYADPVWTPLNIGSPGEITSKMFFLDDKKTGYALNHVDTNYWFATNYRTYHLYKTVDSGASWVEVALNDDLGHAVARGNVATQPINLEVDSVGVLYKYYFNGISTVIHYSNDNGIMWVQLPNLSYPVIRLLMDRKNDLYAVLLIDDGTIVVDKWNAGAKAWERFGSIDCRIHYYDEHYFHAVFDKENNLFIVVPDQRIIYKITPDKTMTMIPVASSVTESAVSFVIDDQAGCMYLSTQSKKKGIYQSLDQGRSWILLKEGTSRYNDHISENYGHLVLDSHGALYSKVTHRTCSYDPEAGYYCLYDFDLTKLTKNVGSQLSEWNAVSIDLPLHTIECKLFADKNDNLYAACPTGSLYVLKN